MNEETANKFKEYIDKQFDYLHASTEVEEDGHTGSCLAERIDAERAWKKFLDSIEKEKEKARLK